MNDRFPVIEKGIPAPAPGGCHGRGEKWLPFLKTLEIGDSFVASVGNMSGIHRRARQLGIKITTRVLSGGKTARYWRLA